MCVCLVEKRNGRKEVRKLDSDIFPQEMDDNGDFVNQNNASELTYNFDQNDFGTCIGDYVCAGFWLLKLACNYIHHEVLIIFPHVFKYFGKVLITLFVS